MPKRNPDITASVYSAKLGNDSPAALRFRARPAMSEPPPPPDNVIHVTFDRARRRTTAPRAHTNTSRTDPAAGLYSLDDVARLFALPLARLRAWERAGIARPSAEKDGARAYTFQDLVVVRAAKDLLEQGVPMRKVRRVLEALHASLPSGTALSELRIVSDGTKVVVRERGTAFDPLTGQLLLDFNVRSLREDVVRALPPSPRRGDTRSAYDHFLEGCRLDGDEAARARAEAAYRKAIELDPTLAGAYTNLGALRLNAGARDEAEALFRRAMMADPSQPEAPYNLGFMRLEDHRPDEAIALLRRAVELDPEFADAHFNLAIALEETGRAPEALPHWAAYLALEPEGPYALAARTRVRDES